MSSLHSAGPSAVGYYFQGLYALIVLLDERSDEAAISVETADDVVLETPGRKTLHQLKHKGHSPPTLTIKSPDLWRTLLIWAKYVRSGESIDMQFVLVTVAPISNDSSLAVLTTAKKSREALIQALTLEATRVRTLRAKAADPHKLPYQDRAEACEAFLDLTVAQRRTLIKGIRLCASSFDAPSAASEVSSRLLSIPPRLRHRITVRLVEWWDRQVVMTLTGERGDCITRFELQQHLVQLLNECGNDALPDDYSNQTPANWKDHLSATVSKQIELVKGFPYQYERAARELWRARNQRRDWLRARFSSASEIKAHDEYLVAEWKDRHDELCAKTSACDDEECCVHGRTLLDWAHFKAPLETRPIRTQWNREFLVRGTYHILAEKLRVGWHPKFRKLLKSLNDPNKP